ncbi:MAG: hydrogenase maturation protease [Candidatus Competibacteraceae bacterium]
MSATEKPTVLVIGVGNPLRGDDGAGAAVIQRLQNRLSPFVLTDHALKVDSHVGLRCAHQLSAIFRLGGRAHLTRPTGIFMVTLQLDSDGVNLMEAWQGFKQVIVVDAACSGAVPGAIHRLDAPQSELQRGLFHYSSHLFGVAEAVELARQLGRLPERLVIYGIEGVAFAYGEGLSAVVAEAVERVAAAIMAELE